MKDQNPKLSRVLKNKGRLILLQNLLKWKFPEMGPSQRIMPWEQYMGILWVHRA